jgi:hypothetical protein
VTHQFLVLDVIGHAARFGPPRRRPEPPLTAGPTPQYHAWRLRHPESAQDFGQLRDVVTKYVDTQWDQAVRRRP